MRSFMLLSTALLLFVSSSIMAQSDAQRRKHANVNSSGVAIYGYDPVAYFKDGAAKKGKSEFALAHRGVTYHFANDANRTAFRNAPDKYEPQYGGWCAYAMGNSNEKVEIDPATFKITNGKLYLFYNAWYNNTLTDWNKNESGLRTKADANWVKWMAK